MKILLEQALADWFGTFEDDKDVLKEKGRMWFSKDDEVDQYLADTYIDLLLSLTDGSLQSADLSVRQKLAVIVVLDQFSRNIYRGDPRSFSNDQQALTLSRTMRPEEISSVRPIERVFLYLPYEHSENLADQIRSVELFRALEAEVAPELKEAFSGFTDYAVRHYEIISRFGRFPHRNEILGRESTAEEIEFLQQPGSSF